MFEPPVDVSVCEAVWVLLPDCVAVPLFDGEDVWVEPFVPLWLLLALLAPWDCEGALAFACVEDGEAVEVAAPEFVAAPEDADVVAPDWSTAVATVLVMTPPTIAALVEFWPVMPPTAV